MGEGVCERERKRKREGRSSYKHITLINYYARVVLTRKLPIVRLQSCKLRA